MRGGWLGVLVAVQVLAGGTAIASPSDSCLRAAAVAERRWALPPNLLLAIGQVESGRRDEATGQVMPWPWSANAAGSDYVFRTADEARAVVGFLRERGIASIDVGCFQVNLHHHPTAFASVAQGFDPDANADFAGRFLRSLFDRSGSWAAAIGDYHSADPALGGEYRTKVLRALRGLGVEAFIGGRAPAKAVLRSLEQTSTFVITGLDPVISSPLKPPSEEPPMPGSSPGMTREGRAAQLSRNRSSDPHVIRLGLAAIAPIPVYTPCTLPLAIRAVLRVGHPRWCGEGE